MRTHAQKAARKQAREAAYAQRRLARERMYEQRRADSLQRTNEGLMLALGAVLAAKHAREEPEEERP